MTEFQAKNYENSCNRELFRIIHTLHEHDLMMDDPFTRHYRPRNMQGNRHKVIRVDLTLLDIRTLKTEAEEILRGLPDELRRKALRYRREDDQLRSIGSSFLLLKAAKGQTIHYNESGKPFVDGGNFFNISHSGDYVVLAEADCPVGVDIERVADIGINEAFAEREKLWVKDSLLRFYVVWTRKESLIKCEGRGFESEPCEIDALHENDFDSPVLYKGKYYSVSSFMIDGHVISHAVLTHVR